MFQNCVIETDHSSGEETGFGSHNHEEKKLSYRRCEGATREQRKDERNCKKKKNQKNKRKRKNREYKDYVSGNNTLQNRMKNAGEN